MRINKHSGTALLTHEGASAKRINKEQELRRSVMAHMLWESSFYEDGEDAGKRVAELVKQVTPEAVAKIAIEARSAMKLRHIPLLLVRELARCSKEGRKLVADTLSEVIQRPDELTEFLAIYWKDGREKLSAQAKKGLGRAFCKFNAYSLAKYNREDKIKLRDVLFLTHAKPKDAEQAETWKKLVEGKLESPDTWEVALSAGSDKKIAWERLIAEDKLGALAVLRNLRNMQECGVGEDLVRKALSGMKTERVLPFRFISAAKYAPKFEPELESAMFRCLAESDRLSGKTVLLVDASGSMKDKVSGKSELMRFEAAAALAILLREICSNVVVYVFSTTAKLVPSRRGFALRDAMNAASEWGGTNTEDAKQSADREGYDRLIILTDEQSHQALSNPHGKGYVINVAAYQNGVGYGAWNHVDGWSEAVLDYIIASER